MLTDADNAKLLFGDDGDMELFHDATDSFLTNNTGTLKIKSGTNSGENIELYTGSNVAIRALNTVGANAVQLMFNGGTKLQTSNVGVSITGDLTVTGDITAFSSSDARLKNDVKPIQDSLAKVNSISGNTFTWNEASKKEGQEDTGVIAQEISAIGLPGTVTIREDGTYAVDYAKLVPLLLEAIKELSNKVDTLS